MLKSEETTPSSRPSRINCGNLVWQSPLTTAIQLLPAMLEEGLEARGRADYGVNLWRLRLTQCSLYSSGMYPAPLPINVPRSPDDKRAASLFAPVNRCYPLPMVWAGRRI